LNNVRVKQIFFLNRVVSIASFRELLEQTVCIYKILISPSPVHGDVRILVGWRPFEEGVGNGYVTTFALIVRRRPGPGRVVAAIKDFACASTASPRVQRSEQRRRDITYVARNGAMNGGRTGFATCSLTFVRRTKTKTPPTGPTGIRVLLRPSRRAGLDGFDVYYGARTEIYTRNSAFRNGFGVVL